MDRLSQSLGFGLVTVQILVAVLLLVTVTEHKKKNNNLSLLLEKVRISGKEQILTVSMPAKTFISASHSANVNVDFVLYDQPILY